jgi:4-hydroxy-tetrahydrodipicolinate reductase
MRIVLVGHGRMGRLVEALAPEYGCEIAAIVTSDPAGHTIRDGHFGGARMAIDFSLPDAVPVNLPQLAERGLSVVIGTTGWHQHEAALREIADSAGIGVLAASNFSLGMNIFRFAVEDAARRFAARRDVGAWIHEAHHDAKKDAPSGTAVTIRAGMIEAGYDRPIDVSSTRAGHIPGTHTVGFDGPAETVTLTHAVRDRAVFARGALEAATWLEGRTGWFGIREMIQES